MLGAMLKTQLHSIIILNALLLMLSIHAAKAVPNKMALKSRTGEGEKRVAMLPLPASSILPAAALISSAAAD